MAVVARIRLPEFGAPEIVPSVRGVASEPATPVYEHKIYVAVGKDAKENKAKIAWTVHQSGRDFKICIIHVLVRSRRIPMGGLGAGLPASSTNEIRLSEHRENEKINMDKILDNCLLVCKQMGVRAEKEYIESDSVEKGIVELIDLHGIRKLVIGAAADRRYFRRMTEIRSDKAIFVRDKAHISCHIWFICDGHLIHTREARTVPAVAEVPTNAPSPTTPTPGAGMSVLSKSKSTTLKRSSTTKLSNPFQDMVKRTFSWNTDQRAVMRIASPSSSDSSPEQPNSASIMPARQDTFQELESALTSLSQRPQSMQSVYHTSQSSISNTQDMNDAREDEELEEGATTCAEAEVDITEGWPKDPGKRLYAEQLEEELEKLKDQRDKLMEELHIAQARKSQLENQFVESDQSRKELELKIIESDEMLRTFRQERELLRIDLDNAREKAEEVSRRSKGDSSGTKYFSEFSMTEITEAAQNFHESLKIGEGGSGSVYRGFLRHTRVAIKIMKFPGMQGSKEFQQEVDVLSKVRHPHLITLIGACPKPCTLVYEYIPNGSLEDWLRSRDKAKQLPWQARIRIAKELCSVLAFLHSYKPHSIVHGDVKPGNILLDEHLMSKLSDFGICRLLSGGQRSINNTTVAYPTDPKGSFGYMDPEFLVTRELTTKFDVYSFGIILLELLTRRPPLGIANVVQRAISTGTLDAILDPLAGEWPYMLAEKLTRLALRCCEISRKNRPDLRSEVWTELESVAASYR
ncbi:U-box domain-containing protein 33-like [Rhodamnia argentea]|uniref:RING-type E3 ubiquitin transferase n=1 Tax=Rhodamnia argentea TaxID=178133 RepID=A0ABM3H7T3_9MYRT|nr:U-box domain-containing protein 33-like [Rhodamnia argentea]